MAIVQFVGFETGDALECASSGGTVAPDFAQTAVKRTGSYALRVNPTGTNTGYALVGGIAATGLVANVSLGLANLFATFYFRYATKPASASEEMLRVDNTGATVMMYLRLTSGGLLALYDAANTLHATGTAVLDPDTWYRIDINVNDSANTQEIKVEGTTDISGTIETTASVGFLGLGKRSNRNGNTVDFFYDDLAIDDAEYPGVGEVKVGYPIGAGAASGWTNGTNSDNFEEVDDGSEQAGNDGDTTYIGASATQDNLDHTFDMSAAATIGIAGDIKAVKTMVVARTASTSGTSAVAHRRLINSTGYELTPLELTTSYRMFAAVDVDDTPGGGGSAWTTTSFDTIEVGMAANTLAQAQRFTAVYVTVWSTGSAPTEIAGRSASDSRADVALDAAVALLLDSRSDSRADLLLDTSTPLALDSRSGSRADLLAETIVSLLLDSRSDSRADLLVETIVSLLLDSRSDSRADLLLDITTPLNLDSRSDSRADLALQAAVSLDLDSRSDSRADLLLDATVRFDLDSRSDSRADLLLEAAVALALASRSGSRSDLLLDTSIALSGLSAALSRAEIVLDTVVALFLDSRSDSRSSITVRVAASMPIESRSDSRADLLVETVVSLLLDSRSNSRAELDLAVGVALLLDSRSDSRADIVLTVEAASVYLDGRADHRLYITGEADHRLYIDGEAVWSTAPILGEADHRPLIDGEAVHSEFIEGEAVHA